MSPSKPPKPAARNDRLATARIQAGIRRAVRDGAVIDLATARLIAASIHRGLASGLKEFAATGRIPADQADYQVMRLEVDLATKHEPQLNEWATALRQFFSACANARSYLDQQDKKTACDTLSGKASR